MLADCYAEKSNGAVLSVIPDLFNGTEVSPSMMATFHTLMSKESGFFSKAGSVFVALYNLPSFFYRNPPAKSQAKIIEVIKDLRANHGIEKVGVIGYCYGGIILHMLVVVNIITILIFNYELGTIAIKLAQADDDLIDCYAANHAGGVKVPEDIVLLKKPGAIIYAEIDVAPVKDIFPKVEDLIKNQPSVNPTIVKSYNEMHGFAIRGDDKVESTRTAKYEVVDLTSKLFKEILKY